MSNFIAVRYDAENGEGAVLSKQFGVNAFPAFMVVNPDGTVRDKFSGAYKPTDMITRLRTYHR